MNMFAKLYETDLGQILVKLDSSDEDGMTAEIRYFFEPEGLGICSCAMQFKEFESAEDAFNKSTEDSAYHIVSQLIEQFISAGIAGE